jgi:mycoredoxin
MQIKVYTTRWCGDCQITKKYLTKFGIPYQEIDIEDDPQAAAYVMQLNDGRRSVPTLVYDGEATSLSRFSRARLDEFLHRHQLLARTA